MGSIGDRDEERSVIGDSRDIGNVDFLNEEFRYNCSTNDGPIVISFPFPLENGKPRFVVAGETSITPITINNTTNEEVQLWSIQIYDSKPKDSFTLSLLKPPSEDSDEGYRKSFRESFDLDDRMLRAGQTLTIWLTCKTKEKGLHTTAIHFNVGDETIERMAFLMAEDQISRSLASNKPYYRPRRKAGLSSNVFSSGVSSPGANNVKAKYIKGSRPIKASARAFRYKLPDYPIPEDMRIMIENKQTPDAVFKGLTKENYVPFFTTLVIMEELKMEEDMRGYDMNSVTMVQKGAHFLTLEVPGLAEKRPSLVNNDFIFAKIASDYENDSVPVYQGYVHRVEAEEVYLKFDDSFHYDHCVGNRYNVQFSYNRINMRRLYQAIEAAGRLDTELLFPSKSYKKRVTNGGARWDPVSAKLNEEQMHAVKMILDCRGGSPFVIHGPPGTGKTITLTEAILQLYRSRKNARILVCAPSNSASDHILGKLLSVPAVEINKKDVFRLNATTRPIEDVKEEYLEFCYVDEQESTFKCPLFEDLSGYTIIVSTYTSASLLHAEGIKGGHFTHIFLDEAGQASEPETMIPLSHFCQRDTVVVLAGDPKQLGPVIYSKDAELHGLGKSYLERLFDCPLYSQNDVNYVAKLVRNYRCHHSILYLPSQLFYNGELVSCKDDSRPSGTWLDVLPDSDFPILFKGVQGVDEREGSNPSWFNRIEASEVVEIVISLTRKGLTKDDIGVITPYRQQVLKIKKALESFVGPDIKVGSVEQFQGQEREVIIVSTVRSTVKHNEFDKTHCLGFLSNYRRFNVAVTRARSLLIVIGNPHIICKDRYWNKFFWHCVDNHSYQGCFLPTREEIFDDECTNGNIFNSQYPAGDNGQDINFPANNGEGHYDEGIYQNVGQDNFHANDGENNYDEGKYQTYDGQDNFQANDGEGQFDESNYQKYDRQDNCQTTEDPWGYRRSDNFVTTEKEWDDESSQPVQVAEVPKHDREWASYPEQIAEVPKHDREWASYPEQIAEVPKPDRKWTSHPSQVAEVPKHDQEWASYPEKISEVPELDREWTSHPSQVAEVPKHDQEWASYPEQITDVPKPDREWTSYPSQVAEVPISDREWDDWNC